MNPTITKIIDLMFRGMPDSEEIRSMREELLTNSQARYDDLVASGKTSNEALGEVLDSLRGVEELLDQYRADHDRSTAQGDSFAFARFERMAEEIDRRFSSCTDTVKTAAGKAATAAENAFGNAMDTVRTSMDSLASSLRGSREDTGSTVPGQWVRDNVYGGGDLFTFTASPAECPRVVVELAADEVEFHPSEDGLIHIQITPEDEPLLLLEKGSGCLTLRRNPNYRAPEASGEEGPLEDTGLFGILTGLGKAIRSTFRQLRTCCGLIRVLLPMGLDMAEVKTASGDISIDGLRLGKLSVTTTSGDITVDDSSILGDAEFLSTSGDTELNTVVVTGRLTLNATSGDTNLTHVTAPMVSTNNVSGDTDIEGMLGQVDCNSVSGDIDISTDDSGLRSITANTTSGDISLILPDDVIPAMHTATTSGDVTLDCPTNPASACVVRLNTVSGDISVDNF